MTRAIRTWYLALSWLAGTLACGVAGLACGDGGGDATPRQRVILLGFDGMDYDMTRQLMAAGRMPNFQRLATMGSFTPLGTSVPPQSPVAWSNLITGMDAGGHGIFDFVHRDPKTMIPYLSTSRIEEVDKALRIGKWRFPLASDRIELLRHGEAFWEVLERHGVETTIIRMPANFPPSGTASREISGMGTPDILGTYGTFSYYTSDRAALAAYDFGSDPGGGALYAVEPRDGIVECTLQGPENPFREGAPPLSTAFTVYVDAVEPVAKLVVGSEEAVLRVGEWSEWIPIEFDLVWAKKVRGICRFYLKQTHPHLQLYATPVNLDPLQPELPISTPPSYAAELARARGRYYTQGMPEDTKALSAGVLSSSEFLAQAQLAGEENIEQYEYVLQQFDSGLLFYYFGNLDQICHMMWRGLDPNHPAYDAERDAPFGHVIGDLYERMDDVVGYTLQNIDPETMLIVMSDHGFTSWRRAFDLNAWLREQDYLSVRDPDLDEDPGFLGNVAWHATRAYGLGLNGLYINLRGRERWGIVSRSEVDALIEEIRTKLLATHDPVTGEPSVSKVYRREEVYEDRGHLEIGPDLIVGYAKGTRCSNESALGAVATHVFSDNHDAWSGDHCMDHEAVPGILLTNRNMKVAASTLTDLGAAVLAEFNVVEPDARSGEHEIRSR